MTRHTLGQRNECFGNVIARADMQVPASSRSQDQARLNAHPPGA